jgi:hypothetical protein
VEKKIDEQERLSGMKIRPPRPFPVLGARDSAFSRFPAFRGFSRIAEFSDERIFQNEKEQKNHTATAKNRN